MQNGKKFRKLVALAVMAVLIATIGIGVGSSYASAQPVTTELSLPSIAGNPANVTLNVTLSQISYITQPTQWLESNISQEKAYYTNSTNWVVPNSGYLFIVNNSTTSTAPSDSAINYPVASSLGSTINYMFADSRLSFNGTGETDYYILSEGNWTTAPSASQNAKSSSAGASQNAIDVIITEHNATTATVSVGYFAWDSAGYQNYTVYSFSSLYLNALQWYDFMIYVQSSGTTVSIMNTTGSILATSSTITPVLDGNFTKISTVSYVTSFAASTVGDMLILDYAYIVDHNTYQTASPSVVIAGAIGQSTSSIAIAPFDPGATSQSSYTQNPNASGNYLSTNVSLSDFSSVTNSSTVAAINSGEINTTLAPAANSTLALSPSVMTDVRTASYLPSSITTNLYVTTWTPAGINTAIVQYLQSTIGAMIGVVPNYVNIISYTTTAMGLNINLSNSTMTEVGNYLDNAIPALLSSNNLALENSQTGALEAGAMAGYFWNNGAIAAPILKSNGTVENPLTGVWYGNILQAGFPVGSYISAGAIVVPQWQFLGFAADGQPIFSGVASFWDPIQPLSGAASAVNNFFHSAASTITNAIKPVSYAISSTASKIVSPGGSSITNAISNFARQVEKTGTQVMPFLGGAVGNIAHYIGGTVSHSLSGLQSGLADVKSSVTGAILAGVKDVKQGVYNIGTSVKNGVSTIYNTIGHGVPTFEGVISPIVTSVRNLPTEIVNGAQTLANGATGFGESIASDAKNLGISIKNGAMNALDTVGNTITSAGQEVKNAFGSVGSAIVGAVGAPFSFIAGVSNNVAHIIEYAAIGGVVVVLVIIALYYFGEIGSHKHKSSGHKLSHKKRW